ncbi:hypothetical protein GUJ93_ZPchr0010g7767 [Zizania palustris]|uniref:Acetyl-CoA carboxylase central domain-containing protein n=1 Tax=Zizania palustris TaxID=103762 RepID=A0A8J5W8I8_ZIZPA|nr:hypothetical protein GUJ93_ZPchr0010g7767 [Zizania palustris]
MQAGDLIARLDLDDPSAVKRAEIFYCSFPQMGLHIAASGQVHKRCAASLNALSNDWEEWRSFFYKRLRRRISEDVLAKETRVVAGEQFSHQPAAELIKKWYMASQTAEWDDDDAFVAWMDNPENYREYINDLKAQRGLSLLLDKMDPSGRAQLAETMS